MTRHPDPDTPLDSLPVPAALRTVLAGLGAMTADDVTALAPVDLDEMHGVGRPGRLLIRLALLGENERPATKAREAAGITLADAGLTALARADLAARHTTTMRHVRTWGEDTLAAVVPVETFAEAEAALLWHGLTFADTARADTFLEGLRHVREHHVEHGFVPGSRELHDGFRLGQWVMMSRQQYHAGKMDPARIHAFESLPFWVWSGGHGVGIAPKRLAETLESAREFAARYGHLDVTTERGFGSLRRSLDSVRDAREAISAAAVADFEALPGWTWDRAEAESRRREATARARADRPPSTQWLARLDELRAEADAAGGLDRAVLRGSARLERIGHWTSTQRVKRESLTTAQRELLEAVPGWTWDGMAVRDARRWADSLARLRAHVDAGNSPDVAALFRVDGYGLGAWVRQQHLGRESLTPDQVTQLEAVPGWTWRTPNPRRSRTPRVPPETVLRREIRWEAIRRLAQDFFATHHVWPPAGTVTSFGLDLGIWVITQRATRGRGELSPRREAALDATPGWRWVGHAQRGRSGPNLRFVCTTLGIEPGAVLAARGAVYRAEALLDEEYRIEVVTSPGAGVYETPTRAWARATAGRSNQNGWDSWSLEFEGEMTPLRVLRDRVAGGSAGSDRPG